MNSTRKIITICSLALGLMLVAETSHADFFDWITGREPTPWSRTTQTAPANRVFAWRPLTTTSTIPAVAPATAVTQAQVPGNYVPATRYRSQWVQVPVTTYRPVFESNPATGLPRLQMRACQRYMWQVRRVPVTVMRPYAQANAGSIFPWCWNWTPMFNNCCTPQYGTATTITTPQPYYSGPDSNQPALAPSPGTSGEPADQVPTLPPQANQGDPTGTSADLSGSNGQSILRRPIREPGPGLQPSTPRIIAPDKTEPIPDLDRQPLLQRQGPELLNPRDRTTRTSAPIHRHFGAIQWASLPREHVTTASTGPAPSHAIQQPSEDPPAPLQWNRVQP